MMIELGKVQTLQAVRESEHGMYLNTPDGEHWQEVLLPKSQVPEDLSIGDSIEVFIYNDAKDRMIATVNRPKLILGETAVLKILDITDIGLFLDWGLERDLFMPFKERIGYPTEGDECLVALYIDKSDRLCATMKVYDYLSTDAPYKKNDWVSGTLYSEHPNLGFFVAVDNRYHGLIPHKEMYGNYQIGDIVETRIQQVRDDGKLELSLRRPAYAEIEGDAKKILDLLQVNDGVLPMNDKTDPETIKSELSMSKKAFKRAIGRLLKEGAIEITDDGICMTWE